MTHSFPNQSKLCCVCVVTGAWGQQQAGGKVLKLDQLGVTSEHTLQAQMAALGPVRAFA